MHPSNSADGRPRARQPFPYFEHLGLCPPMVVYLLHLDPPYKHAAHYLGSTDDLQRRLSQHGGTHGSPLLLAQKQAGGSWHLVRTWAGGKQKESWLKSNNGKRYCPECTSHPLPGLNTQPRQRKTRNQRRQQQQAAALAAQTPERISVWLDLWHRERIPVPVPAEEWLTPDALADELRAMDAVEANWSRQVPVGLYAADASGGYR
jgi:hypothetical protein